MAQFKESEHPRDKEGKFTDKELKGMSSKELSDKLKIDLDDAIKVYGEKKKPNMVNKISNITKDNKYLHTPDINYKHQKGYIAGAKKGYPMTFKQADSGNVNPFKGKIRGYDKNCATCVATYIARRLGYNVRALPYDSNNNAVIELSKNVNKVFKEHGEQVTSFKKITQNHKGFLDKTIKEGEIYTISFSWKNYNESHIVVAEKKNNNLTVYDPQCNKLIKNDKLDKYFKSVNNVLVLSNLTNVTLDEKYCDKIMKKV